MTMAALRQTTLSSFFTNTGDASAASPAQTSDRAEVSAAAPARAEEPSQEDGSTHDEFLGTRTDHTAASAVPAAPLSGLIKLPEQAAIEPLGQPLLPSFRRLITTLLPVRYPDKTYATILENAEGNIFCRLALWHPSGKAAAACSSEATRGSVVGAVCARVQDVPGDVSSLASSYKELYVQMLAVLSPYRSQGLASALLEGVIAEAVRLWGVSRVSAHVWEVNEDALEWYERRGFVVEEEMARDYYRKLRPAGAWIVSKSVGVVDGLKR